MSKLRTTVDVRPYEDSDESAVLRLLVATLGEGPGGARSAGYFRWKHLDNPFGRSFMLVAEADGQIVGLRAFMRWEFVARGQRLRAVRAVDTATHPRYQGQGIFSRLTLEALDALRSDVDFVFNTPNDKSLPGYLKMGWQVVGAVPVYVRIRRPIRFARRARSWRQGGEAIDVLTPAAPTASDPLAAADLGELLTARAPTTRISTARDPEYLMWRYAHAPLLGYRAVQRRAQDKLEGLAVFRVRPRGRLIEATIAEMLVPARARRTARQLLRDIGVSAPIDHLTCTFPTASAELTAARSAAFLRAPGGPTLVVNPLGHRFDLDPLDLESWALSTGDVEVF